MSDVGAVLDRVFRADGATVTAALARRLGALDVAEDAVQDAVAEALRRWPDDGVPDNPAGWLVVTGWRKAVDRLRREATGRDRERDAAGPPPEPRPDDRLALVFACCHPLLAEPARVALTLSAACGLGTAQIAAAFLVPVPTMAQRLVRAKRQLRDSGVRVGIPVDRVGERLPAVLDVIALVYNEGYLAPHRSELAREGLDLARQLAALLPSEPEAAGLAALLELHEARAGARFDADGEAVLLERQDRSRWDPRLTASAARRLAAALPLERPGPYQVQAAIAVQHALAQEWAATDWAMIRSLYERLDDLRPSPVVRLGRAVATRYTHGPRRALEEVDALGDRLAGYRMWHAVRAELLTALDRGDEARTAALTAFSLTENPVERGLIARRIADLDADP
jgi:predicted RNA polymerase sigma factor